MLSAFDSFLTYLNDELEGDPVVHWVRMDPTDDLAHLLKDDALNVSLLGMEQIGSWEELLVSLDVIGSNERQVLGWVKRIRDVLIQHQYAEENDHETNPTDPISLDRLVSWERDDIRFATVAVDDSYRRYRRSGDDDRQVHLNATFPIRHVRQ